MVKYDDLCEICKDYDDSWDITCFCEKCAKLVSEGEVE